MGVSPAVAASPTSPAVAVWEDFIDIFHSPSDVFARRERASAWVPILVVTAFIGTFFFLSSGLLEPLMDAEFRRAMAAGAAGSQTLDPEAMSKARAFGAVMAKVMAFIMVPIIIFLLAVVLWLAGKAVGASQVFGAALVVAAYSYVPRMLESLLTTFQALLMDPASLDGRYRVSISAARFLDPDTASPVLLAIAGRFDVFTIWTMVLLAIGLSVTGRIPRYQAAVGALIVWVVASLPEVIPAIAR